MNILVGFIGLPIVTSPLVYIAGHSLRVFHGLTVRRLSLAMVLLLWFFWWNLSIGLTGLGTLTVSLGMIHLQMDRLGFLISTLALLLATVAIVFSYHDVAEQTGEEKYYAMIFILTGMVMGLVCAGDLFNLWVWFEGTAISSYLLVAFYNQRGDALAACIKYFIQTAVGSVLVLFAIGLVFIQTGTLDLMGIQPTVSPLFTIAAALFVMGFGVKAALFPNFTWLPDAYAESPTGISALLSGVVTVTSLIALLKVLVAVMSSPEQWGYLLLGIAVCNIVLGNILALAQTQVKRILAYSSISHIGFILLAVGIGLTTQSELAMRASLLHLFFHGLMKSLAFLVVGAFAYVLASKRQLTISDLSGVARRYPALAVALVIALLSLAGVPMMAGFVSKWQIFIAGVQSGSGWMIALMIFAALNAVFSLAYYLPIMNALNSQPENDNWQQAPNLPLTMRLPILVLAVSIVLLGLFPNWIDGLVQPAGMALYALMMR